jgi:hypothetical protein
MATPPKMTWHPKDQAIAGTTDDNSDDIFTRPTRAEMRGTPLLMPLPIGVATIPIVCYACGVRAEHPITWSGRLCRVCRSDLPKAQERVFSEWAAIQGHTDADTMNRHLMLDMARKLTHTDRMQLFLDRIRAGEDARKLGDDKRTKAILKDVAAGMSDAEVIEAAQQRVAKGINNALAAKDELSYLLAAEQRYHTAMQEIDAAMDEAGLI